MPLNGPRRVTAAASVRPAHVTAWAHFPRWSTVVVAVAVPALALVAYAAPLLHGTVAQQPSTAVPVAAARAAQHDFETAEAATTAAVAVPPGVLLSTSLAAVISATPGQVAMMAAVSPLASDGIPKTALDAYENAARWANARYVGCDIPWPLLAGIGRVESDHGRYGGAVLYSNGTSSRKILGIPLDGTRSALIPDTDNGRLDGNTTYDRAVGPMQFIPSTWASYRVDGNGDGRVDPFNIFDAAAAAADYLCVAGGDLGTEHGQERAVLAYNHSSAYLTEVLGLERTYAAGVGLIVPVGPTAPTPPKLTTRVPPVDPGPPLGSHPTHKPSKSPSPSSSAPTTASSTSASPTSASPTSARPSSTSAQPSSSATSSSSSSSCPTTATASLTDSPTAGSTAQSDTPVLSESASESASDSALDSALDSASGSASDSESGSATPSDSLSATPSC
jgi:membrane-bound lytic murein transglycosylase B